MTKSRPLYQQTAETLGEILAEMDPGSFLPSEPTLARQLGVSRATLREAMRSFEERGLILRRQGVGTIVTGPPKVIETGLEVLDSIETLAQRIGLKVDMGALEIEVRPPRAEERVLVEDVAGEKVVEVSRVIFTASRPVAYLVDVVAHPMLPEDALREGFSGSVLDLILSRGEPSLDFSRTEITAVSAPPQIARRLSIQRGDVLMRMQAKLYDKAGAVVDLSHSYFIPGVFRFHVVRRVGRLRP